LQVARPDVPHFLEAVVATRSPAWTSALTVKALEPSEPGKAAWAEPICASPAAQAHAAMIVK